MANFLPEDLIFFGILARLPLKFLLRVTLVCKRWHFLITNPGSIKFHIAHTSYNHNHPSFLINWYSDDIDNGFTFVNKDQNNDLFNRINDSIYNTYKQIFSFYFSFMEDSNSVKVDDKIAISVIGCVDGLVCLCQNLTYGMFFVWNPVMKMLKTVTKPPKESYKRIRSYTSSFCYDAVDRDYKIIDIEKYEMHLELGIYSCNLGTWRHIRYDSLPDSVFFIVGNLNGMVYLYFYSVPSVLMAFDVHDEIYKWLPCPKHYVKGAKSWPFIKWKDSLGIVVDKEPNNPVCQKKIVYIYNETTGTWIEQYIAPDSLDPYKLLLGFENGDVVVHEDRGIVKLFEAESSQFKLLTDEPVSSANVMRYTESLVCINGMQKL